MSTISGSNALASAGTAATDDLRDPMVENGAEMLLLKHEDAPRTIGRMGFAEGQREVLFGINFRGAARQRLRLTRDIATTPPWTELTDRNARSQCAMQFFRFRCCKVHHLFSPKKGW